MMITPKMVTDRIEMYYAGGLLEYNPDNLVIPKEQRVAVQGATVARYLVERFQPRTLLDIGCKTPALLKSIMAIYLYKIIHAHIAKATRLIIFHYVLSCPSFYINYFYFCFCL
jgi:hypothetical protein